MKSIFTLSLILFSFLLSGQNYYMSNSTDSTCSGIFYDSGGPSGNYGTNENLVKTFVSSNGQRVKVTFNMFNLDDYDYLEIYDGPSTAYPKIGKYTFSNNPGVVRSSGDAITFRFYSNYSTYNVDPGWQAQLSCDGAALQYRNMDNAVDTITRVVFCDHAGPAADYSAYEDYTHTFVASSQSFLKAEFLPSAFQLYSGDTLRIFDGSDVNASLLAVLVAGSNAETITSSTNALTFRFASNYTSQGDGWQAEITETNTAATPQHYDMSPGERFVCSGFFRDHAGASNYGVDQNTIQTFTSYNGHRIKFDFTMFNLNDYDYLEIYDGPSTAYPKIGKYTYSNSPGVVLSSGKSLTFRFYSNYSTYNVDPGWEAQISCDGPQLQVINMAMQTDTITECMFYDHEGGSSNYSDYSDYTHTFVADTSQYLKAEFNNVDFGLSTGDTLWVHDGADITAPLLAMYVNGSKVETRTSSGNAMTFRFTSDHTLVSDGWQAHIQGTNTAETPQYYDMSPGERFVCSGFFRDHGGASNYGVDQNSIQTFTSYNGNRIKFDFTMFDLDAYDYLEIYDGPSTAYPKIGKYTYSNSPGVVLSSGKSLTFRFYSNYSTYNVDPGWEAQISCDGPQLQVINMATQTDTITECMFYDHEGGSSNYSDYSDYTHTFVADTSQYLKAEFNNVDFGLSTGDTLWVHDGTDITAPLLAMYVNGSKVETRTSSGNAMTFRFTSDHTLVSDGWQAHIQGTNTAETPQYYDMSPGERFVCSGFFRDHGGASNYGVDQNSIQTFTSYSGNRIKFDFTMFDLDAYDYLEIYDGPSTAYPKIGKYTYSNSPGVVLSSGKSLTFRFYSNYSTYNVDPGWEAQISCQDTVYPVYLMNNTTDTISQAVFYDHNGPSAYYSNYENYTHTFYADTGSRLKFEFNNLHNSLANGDTLWIYDGPDIQSQLLGAFVIGSKFENFISSGDAVTFRFKSDHTSESRGWQVFIEETNQMPSPVQYAMSSGIRYSCDGIFRDHNGSSNYSDDQDQIQTFIARGGQRLKVAFSAFHTYHSYDYLKIYDGLNTSANLLGTWSGSSGPGTVIASDSALTFVFHSNYSYTSSGWEAQFSCININPPIVTQQPQSQQICQGDTAIFMVAAAGGDTIEYQWKKDGVTLATEQDSVLMISDVQSADLGSYYCVVTNPYGVDSTATAALSMYALPSVNLSLNDICAEQTAYNLVGGAPSGGTYSGNFVSNGSFDRASSGSGDFPVEYTYTNSNGCSSTAYDTLHIRALPAITFSALPGKCENDAAFALNHAVPVGGTYYGTGVSSGNFNPAVAGQGTHTIYYTYTDQYGCSSTAQQTIDVDAVPTVNLSSLADVCVNGSAFPLSGGSPVGGTYSGSGVSNGVFDPSLAGTGNHPIVYTYTNANGCSAQDVEILTVYSAPSVILNLQTDICIDNGPLTLSGGSPAGGSYSGTGVINGVFYPSVAGAGTHSISYTYADANACSNVATQAITVHNAPQVSVSGMPAVCSNQQAFALNSGSPSGGTYSGTGINNGMFDPAVAGAGVHTITYQYTDSYGCSGSATGSIEVKGAPLATINSIPASCEDTSGIQLSASPSGGVFSGAGVSGNTFNSFSAGAGNHWIKYFYTAANGCSTIDSIQAIVHALPVVSILNQDSAFCSNDASKILFANPSGGLFSGNGISGNVFNPSVAGVGSHSISYFYTDGNGCSASDSSQFVVHGLPAVSITNLDSAYCAYDSVVALSAIPAGGSFSGNAVSGSSFYPAQTAPGKQFVYYEYIDTNGCFAADSQMVEVLALPVVNLGPDTSVKLSEIIVLDGGPGYDHYHWYNFADSRTIVFEGDSAGSGTHQVWLKVKQNLCWNSDTIQVEVIDDTGILIEDGMSFLVYPNPMDDVLNLKFEKPIQAELYLMGVKGDILYRKTINHVKEYQFNVATLAAGVYYLKIVKNERAVTIKLIKN